MVLIDSHLLHHLQGNTSNVAKVVGSCSLVKHLLREKFLASMESSTSISDLLLAIGSASEVASPVAVISVSVGEHVIILHRPSELLLLKCI
jgi:hypothetical protein